MIVRLVVLLCFCIPARMALQVSQPYRVVASGGTASGGTASGGTASGGTASGGTARLRCSFRAPSRPQELRLTLYRGMYGEQEACAFSFNVSQSSILATQGPLACLGEIRPGMVDLAVSGLHGHDTDIYRCMVEVLYPPPYLIKVGNGTLVYIPEQLECPAPPEKVTGDPESNPVSGYLLPASIFACIIIIAIFIITLTYKVLTSRSRPRGFVGATPVVSKKVDCRFGYENFL